MVSKQALWKQKQRKLRKEIAATDWKIEPGGQFTQWSKKEAETGGSSGSVGRGSVGAGESSSVAPSQVDLSQNTDASVPDPGASIIAETISKWPAGPGSKNHPAIKAKILDAAVEDMKALLSSNTKCPTGQDHANHLQVLEFMNTQMKNPGRARTELAIHVANGWGRGRKMSLAIMRRERDWVRNRFIVPGRIGKVKPKKGEGGAMDVGAGINGGEEGMVHERARVDESKGGTENGSTRIDVREDVIGVSGAMVGGLERVGD